MNKRKIAKKQNFFTKIFSFTSKSRTTRESELIERPSSYSVTEGAQPTQELSPDVISLLYDSSALLKKYIKSIVDECLRYRFEAVPTERFKDSKRAKNKAEQINSLLLHCNKRETFREVREQYLKDLLLYARAGIELEPYDSKEIPKALYAAPGYCIKLNTDKKGNFISDNKAYILVDPLDPEKTVGYLPYTSLIYFTYDMLSDRVYGVSPVKSIYYEVLTDLKISEGMKRGAGEVKTGIVTFKRAPKSVLKDIISRLMNLIRTNSRVKVVAANAEDAKFIDLTNMPMDEAIEVQKWIALKANIYNIPAFKLNLGNTGSLTAREQRDELRSIVENLILYELDKLNAILIKARLGWNDVKIICPNLATKLSYERTRIAVRLVNAGIITPNEAREKYLGIPRLLDPAADQLTTRKVDEQNKD